MVPPYCGVPRVSHQFPVALVVTTEVAVVEVVDDTVDVVTDVEVVVTTAVVCGCSCVCGSVGGR